MIAKLFSQLVNVGFNKPFTIRTQLLLGSLALVCTAAWCYQRADAVAYNWTNSAGGDWTTDGNWSASGEPDGTDDTASLGNVGNSYTTTLGVSRTIGGLTLSGTDPTLTVNGSLVLTGTSNINGGVLNGTGTVVFNNGSTTNWTGGTTGGTLTFLVPHEHTVNINNDPSTFALATGQKLHIAATGGVGGFPGDLQTITTTFSNGFANSGTIQLGNPTPGDNYGVLRLIVNNGTVTNNSGGNINFLPRSASNSGSPWNTREIRSSIQNDGIITSFASDGILGGTGKTVANTGTINTDHSIYTEPATIPGITIDGTTFTNTGILNTGANHGGLGGGRISLRSTTSNLNAGTTITGPGNLELAGTTVNVDSTTSISGLSTLTLGRNNVTTTINWGIVGDLTDPLDFTVPGGANVTWDRPSDWTIQSDQSLVFQAPPVGGDNPSHLNLDVNVNNDGHIVMGRTGGNFHVQANLTLTGATTFTNDATGVIDMHARGTTADDATWNTRYINGNVVNNGIINAYASNARLGDTGKTVSNAGTLNIDSSQFTAPRKAILQMSGNSFTNVAGGNINLLGGQLWVNTPTFNYDGGTISATTGGEIRLGTTTLDANFIFNGGAEVTGPVTWIVHKNSDNTITRSSTWNILSGQTLAWEVQGGSGAIEGLTVNQDMTNSGLLQLGDSNPATDSFVNQKLTLTSTNSQLTNNSDGVINMYPRSNSSTNDTPWSIRRIEGELINNGALNVYTRFGNIGKAGMDHINNGSVTLDKSFYDSGATGFTPELIVTGNSFLNGSVGVIEGNGIFDVTSTTFNNAGTLSPGLSAGLLTVQGNVNFQSGGTIYIEILGENGVAGVDYDQLIVTGNVNGLTTADLVVDITSPSLDLTGDIFTVLTSANDLSGVEFNSITFLGASYNYDIEYGDGFVRLSNIESFVPEPSSGILLLMGLLALRRRNRRKA